jgi:integrase
MRQRLTASFVTNAAAEHGKPRTIFWDTNVPSFGLMVTDKGARSYVIQYRAHGRSRRITLDADALSLDEARREARKHLGDVAKGGDPLSEKRRQSAAAADTLQAIADSYFRREGKKIRTADDRRRTLERLVFPKLGQVPINDITRADIVRLLDRVEDDSGPVMADRTLAYLRKILNWHATRSEYRSPIVRGMARTKPAERARDRILSDGEIRAVWQAAEKKHGPFTALVKFILLTGARRSEAAGMTRSELTGSDWLIPGGRHKSKREFLLPLSKAAMDVIAAIPVIGDMKDGPIFTTDGQSPISGFSKFKRGLDKASGVTGWTLHDCRRTARSLMSRSGVPADHCERAIGHVIPGVRGVYDRHAYYREKQSALEALAGEIAAIVG